MLTHIDLNLLRVLGVFGVQRSVLATARALRITPSAVSQALKRLEKESGLRLFIRSHKTIALSSDGARLLASTLPFLKEMEQTVEDLANEKGTPQGTVRVGAPTEFATNFLIPTFSRFAAQYPTISLKLRLGSPRSLIDGLLKNELDLAYCDDGPYFSPHSATLSCAPAFKEELVLACSRSFFARHLSEQDGFKQLIRLKHVDYVDDHSAVNIWYRHHFKKAPARLDLALVAENVNALIQGIRNGLGLGMVPSYLIAGEVRKGKLVVIRTGRPELENPILLVQHQDRVAALREKLLISFVKRNASEFEASQLR